MPRQEPKDGRELEPPSLHFDEKVETVVPEPDQPVPSFEPLVEDHVGHLLDETGLRADWVSKVASPVEPVTVPSLCRKNKVP